MNLSEFDELTRSVISPYLETEQGFLFSEGTYVRDFQNKVRHLIMFDFDVKKGKTFRVILGFNSPLITGEMPPSEAGAFGVKYLDESGLSEAPSNYPCFNKEAALKSLVRVKASLDKGALSWMSSIDTLEKVADVAEEQYPFIKGKLYFTAGSLGKAKTYLSRHLAYLLKQKKTVEVNQGIQDTQDMLKHCV